MTGFESYQIYLAMKNHFTKDGYDFFKYNGKVRVKESSYIKRNDKLFFEKLAKHDDPYGLLVSNLSQNPKLWIRDISYSDAANETYIKWLKIQQSMKYTVKQDLAKLHQSFDDNFIIKANEHPILLRAYLGGEITLETICLLLELSKASKHWNSKLQYDLIYEELKMKFRKYTPFIKTDRVEIKKIIVDYYN